MIASGYNFGNIVDYFGKKWKESYSQYLDRSIVIRFQWGVSKSKLKK